MYLKALSVICWRVKVLDSWLWHKISVMLFLGTGACDPEVFSIIHHFCQEMFCIIRSYEFFKVRQSSIRKIFTCVLFSMFLIWYDKSRCNVTIHTMLRGHIASHYIEDSTKWIQFTGNGFSWKEIVTIGFKLTKFVPKNPIKNGSALVLMGRGRAWGWWFWMCSFLPTERNIFKMADEISQDITAFQLVTIQAEAIQISGMNHWWSLPADELAG